MKRLSRSSWSLIVIMAFMLVFILLSLRLRYFAPKLLPIVISSIVFILAAIELVKEISAASGATMIVEGDERRAGGKTHERAQIYLYLPIAAWVAGFVLAIYLAGFIIGSALFVLLFMRRHGSRWLMAVVTTVLFTAAVYCVFELVLGVELYRGLLPHLLVVPGIAR